MRKENSMTDEEILEIAKRIYNAFTYEMRDADRNCPEDLVEDILDEPLEVIKFLLDYIENN